ncbi:proteasome endopeptidase complex beta subunit [Brevibacterium sanguinis]|uniref:Proteasome subunit beta n=2 Tax=Brevibacterium TaxID=1696 RepID=A0A366IK49_9MICO|nr:MULTISPECIES: proteasome subunit beta [Brevibacterium]RBP64697.1 proteasome endopeptidase complex beta subunit [Brevibacterium sanguinis]RBP71660.1 proteasome endopeptidase complex beta subunit [Brevibacterium celere]
MAGFPPAFLTSTSNSFAELARAVAPETLPALSASDVHDQVPEGTTIVCLKTATGILMAGDRRATIGHAIASHAMEKVHPADDSSVIGIAGTAGVALELIRLFQLELEHYEKIEGARLSLEGKANRLASMLRGNLGLAMQGLAVVPLFAGVDDSTPAGQIFSFDVTGGKYEEHRFHSIGSGSGPARGALKKLWEPGLDVESAITIAVEALFDASDDDSATGGPDFVRGIAPTVFTVDTVAGAQEVDPEAILATADEVVARRRGRARS